MSATVTAAAIGVGGSVIVALAAFWANVKNTNKTTALTLRAVELTEQGQVTDRYTKAIEQLGSAKAVDVRIGGIYALERVARDSPRDQSTVIEVLSAFVREHSRERWPPAEDGAEEPERTTRPDVQAAVTVIGRRNIQHDGMVPNLVGAQLPHVNLLRADLRHVILDGVNLSGANLMVANFSGQVLISVDLSKADLRDANFSGAQLDVTPFSAKFLTGEVNPPVNLSGAFLANANFTGATLNKADLRDAFLAGADFTGALFNGANLSGAGLASAKLSGAKFPWADLSGAIWPENEPVPEGWRQDNDSGQLWRDDTTSDEAPAD